MVYFSLKRIGCVLLLSLCAADVCSQQPFELKVSSANDNYCFQYHDGYYTNGLFLRVNYLPRSFNLVNQETRKLTRVTAYYQLGQMIFTPDYLKVSAVSQIDRPYAGYLFVQKGMNFFYRRGHILNANLSLGTIGRTSLAQQTQLFVHQLFDLIPPNERLWSYQIKNEVGANLQVQYWHELMPTNRRKRWFDVDVHGTSQITLGNTFTNASAGLLIQGGLFERPNHSSLYDARLERQLPDTRKPAELYFFVRPTFQYQVYNATIEGRLFSTNAGSVLSGINPWVYMYDVGVVYSQQRWTFQLAYSWKEKEALTMRQADQYATITAAYCFRERQ